MRFENSPRTAAVLKLKRNGTPLPDYLNMYKSGQLSSRPSSVPKNYPFYSPSLSLPFGFDKIFSREGRGHARSRVRKRFSKWVVINRNGVKQSLSKGVVTTFSLADESRLSLSLSLSPTFRVISDVRVIPHFAFRFIILSPLNHRSTSFFPSSLSSFFSISRKLEIYEGDSRLQAIGSIPSTRLNGRSLIHQ